MCTVNDKVVHWTHSLLQLVDLCKSTYMHVYMYVRMYVCTYVCSDLYDMRSSNVTHPVPLCNNKETIHRCGTLFVYVC